MVRSEMSGRDFGRADLDGFLHDEVHVFPFRDRLGKCDAAGKRRRGRFVQFAETNLGAIDGAISAVISRPWPLKRTSFAPGLSRRTSRA